MKPILLLTIFVHLVVNGFSQVNEFENYYPENKLYKKLKVKSVLDIIASPPRHHYKMEYDALPIPKKKEIHGFSGELIGDGSKSMLDYNVYEF